MQFLSKLSVTLLWDSQKALKNGYSQGKERKKEKGKIKWSFLFHEYLFLGHRRRNFLFESVLPLTGHDSVVPNNLQIILYISSYSRRQVYARVVKSEGR